MLATEKVPLQGSFQCPRQACQADFFATMRLKSAMFSTTLGKLADDFNSIAYPRGGE
jgi:hypothetical protein